MIHTENIAKLVRAVAHGRIKGARSHKVLGVAKSTFNRWVKDAERRGVRFIKNPRGGCQHGPNAVPAKPWQVKAFGPFKDQKP